VIHEWLLMAVHTQALVVDTLTDAEPPAAPTSRFLGETEYEHDAGGGGGGGGGG
jgi:hypothetical protein